MNAHQRLFIRLLIRYCILSARQSSDADLPRRSFLSSKLKTRYRQPLPPRLYIVTKVLVRFIFQNLESFFLCEPVTISIAKPIAKPRTT